jgi:hypothetical protein
VDARGSGGDQDQHCAGNAAAAAIGALPSPHGGGMGAIPEEGPYPQQLPVGSPPRAGTPSGGDVTPRRAASGGDAVWRARLMSSDPMVSPGRLTLASKIKSARLTSSQRCAEKAAALRWARPPRFVPRAFASRLSCTFAVPWRARSLPLSLSIAAGFKRALAGVRSTRAQPPPGAAVPAQRALRTSSWTLGPRRPQPPALAVTVAGRPRLATAREAGSGREFRPCLALCALCAAQAQAAEGCAFPCLHCVCVGGARFVRLGDGAGVLVSVCSFSFACCQLLTLDVART